MPIVASYCTTFLKPEMLHIYRQISALQQWQTFVITRERQCADQFPMPADGVELLPNVRSNFVRRFWLKYIKREPPIVYRGEYGVLAKVLERRSVDVLHVYFGHTGVHLLPFLKRYPGASVVSFHGMDVQARAHDPSYEPKLREVLQTTTLVLARSNSLLDRLRELGCPESKLRVNRTGIPLAAFPQATRSAPADGAWHLVQACRLIEKKGLDDALHAFAALVKQCPLARFTIAGEGPLLDDLTQLCAQLGITENVNFAGFLKGSAVNELYQSAHLFIHPSRITADGNQEGIPNAMLEAMATGLPVIATLHGGIPEAVRDGVTGLLSAERDVPALTANLLSLINDPDRWQTMSQAAASDVREHFESQAQIAKLERIYEEARALQ
jgi:colanic acid/amylovoran biosynthesis glycosyltransferase